MPRPEKVQAVADIKQRMEDARAVFVAEYAGLSVKQQQALRRGLRDGAGEFKIVKMTLARRAAEELGHDELSELLSGPTGLAFAMDDAASTAKALHEFAKEHAQLVLKGAMLGGQVMAPEKIKELAELEPREVILAKLAGAFKAPMAQMAGLLAAMPRNLASMMLQLVDKKESGEAASGAAPVDEAPAEEEAPAEAVEAAAAEEPASEETASADEASDDATDEANEPAPAPEASADDEDEAPAADDTAETAEEE